MPGKQFLMTLVLAFLGGALGVATMQHGGPIREVLSMMRRDGGRQEQTRALPRDAADEADQRGAGGTSAGQQVVRLGDATRHEVGIEVQRAGAGTLQRSIILHGEVMLNADRVAHLVPRVPGIVQQVHKHLGDQVQAGEVTAILESRELATLHAAYLAAKARLALAQTTFRREADLWQKKISAEHEYLEAKQALEEARITLHTAEQQLYALGFSSTSLARLASQPATVLTQYAITAPFDGAVIEKHLTLGEALKEDTTVFVIADLRSVWVDLQVYQHDLPFVHAGQPVVMSAGHELPDAQGTLSYVGPILGEHTRTALARVVLLSPKGPWRPGLFVTAQISAETVNVPVLVPETSLQTLAEHTVVFVETAEGFAPRPVTLGRSNDTQVEITAGLQPGERYVTRGAFTIKAQLSKATFGGDQD